MNLFRLIADLLHLASIFILLLKIKTSRSAAGISFKTQALYALVFCTRYLDLFTHFVSVYNTVMKIFFIVSAFYIIYLMKVEFKTSWDLKQDTLRVEFLIVPAAVLALFLHHTDSGPLDILWTFSIYLESVAILPQLFQLTKTGESETITIHYLAALGGYRALYILNWVYRYVTTGYLDWVVVLSGLLQTGLYGDFLYVYITRVLNGRKFRLPA